VWGDNMISILLVLAGLITISVVVDPSEERFPTIKDVNLIVPCR
jgi:hypothetical protein